MEQFACYRCTTGDASFKNIVEHSITQHEKDLLKVRSKELNITTGKLGYRTNTFFIVPRDIAEKKQKIKVLNLRCI